MRFTPPPAPRRRTSQPASKHVERRRVRRELVLLLDDASGFADERAAACAGPGIARLVPEISPGAKGTQMPRASSRAATASPASAGLKRPSCGEQLRVPLREDAPPCPGPCL